jgi:hypothetical protein
MTSADITDVSTITGDASRSHPDLAMCLSYSAVRHSHQTVMLVDLLGMKEVCGGYLETAQ